MTNILRQSAVTSPNPPVINCAVYNRRSLWGYRGDENVPFIKITCADPKALPRVKDESLRSMSDRSQLISTLRAFERGQIDFNGLFPPEILTYESNIAYTLRFMIDTRVVGMNWVEIPGGTYELLEGDEKRSLCQIELSCRQVLRAYG